MPWTEKRPIESGGYAVKKGWRRSESDQQEYVDVVYIDVRGLADFLFQHAYWIPRLEVPDDFPVRGRIEEFRLKQKAKQT